MLKRNTNLSILVAIASGCSQPSNLVESDGTSGRISQGSAPIIVIEAPHESHESADASPEISVSEAEGNETATDPVIIGGAYLNCQASAKDSVYQCALTNAGGVKIPISSYLPTWKLFYDGGKELVLDCRKLDGEETYEASLQGLNQGLIRLTIIRDGLKISYDYLIPRPSEVEAETPAPGSGSANY